MIEKKKEITITPEAVVTNTDGGVDENSHSREKWGHPCEFILSCLGYAVGYGNMWRFPYLCFKNGGAVFLIPYCIMLIIAGIPMFFLELVLGQYVSLGPNMLFPELSPIFSGLGWAMFITTVMITTYYNIILAWSFFTPLPHCFTYEGLSDCRNLSLHYYNKTCHTIEEYCSLSNLMSYNSTHCYSGENTTLAIEAESTITQFKIYNKKFTDHSLQCFHITNASRFKYFRNRLLRVTGKTWDDMGLTLNGAYEGIKFYILQPNITKLHEATVWNDAASQIFFSLGIGSGSLITLSSYSKLKNNCMRDAILIAICNCATSLFGGFVTFSILGFIAHENNVPVQDVVNSGSGLAFIAYPTAISRMPYPPVWAVLFFFMLIALGIDSQFAYVETLSTGLCDQFKIMREHRSLLMIGLTSVLFLLGIPMCLEGGVYLFEVINLYAAGFSVLFIAICEIVIVAYIYGFKRFMKNINVDMEISVNKILRSYFGFTWLFSTPVSLIGVFALGVYFFKPVNFGTYIFPPEIQGLGWTLTAISKGKELLLATPQFCPAYLRSKETVSASFKYTHDNEGFIPDILEKKENI
ncbi:Sodium- and chloride-dependent glycine transporter 2 [Armadillidium nasatum]|uniref:Transporter n=1 Tax=Armadillidium nasatum TaxID=96803 RepID=A0A5N5TG11_9CRUS|nr:Sodium- and chloride-dependent glycine transporter 2 [Armadillidium nasatum]